MIDEQVDKLRYLVPSPLAYAAAHVLCERDDDPCPDCIEEAAGVLAYTYVYHPQASSESPCPACEFTRYGSSNLFDSCLYHRGVDDGILGEPDEPEDDEPEDEVNFARPWYLSQWTGLIISIVLTVAWIGLAVWVVLHP